MGFHVFEREQVVDLPVSTVFDFFCDVNNLAEMTPPAVHFRFEGEPPTGLEVGSEVSYRLRIVGVPLRWTTRITQWDPPHRFADLQARGPYSYWLHSHTFSALTESRTLMRDRVIYKVPLGPLGEVARRLFVLGQLRRIFDYRERALVLALGEMAGAR